MDSLLYVAGHGDTSLLYQRLVSDDSSDLRGLGDVDVKPIAGTEGAFDPFFSPDGEWVAFFAKQRLHKVSIRGGRPEPLCAAPDPFGGTWGPDKTIVFASDWGSQLNIVSEKGGPVQELATRRGMLVGSGISSYHWPHFLPGGQSVVISTGQLRNRLEVISLSDGRVVAIQESGNRPLYVPGVPGHLLFGRAGDLYAIPFDCDRLVATGGAVPVIENVRSVAQASGGAHHTAIADNGTIAYVPGPALDVGVLTWRDRDGREGAIDEVGTPALAGEHGVYGAFQISSDGKKLAVTISDMSLQIWIYDLEGRSPPIRITREGQNFSPVWHDGDARVAFTSLRNDNDRLELLSVPVDGSGDVQKLLPLDWEGGNLNKPRSDFGDSLLFDASRAESGSDIWIYDFREGRVEPFLQTTANEGGAMFSPDGTQVAYASDRSGHSEVYVVRRNGQQSRRISTIGGEEPVWDANGKTVFYRNRNQWMAADASGRSDTLLFSGPYLNVPGISYGYDPGRDRFLLIRGTEEGEGQEGAITEIRVIVQGLDRLERFARPDSQP